ncbi:MAG: LamG-like jellyroll fold domain-containing protein [bacterium]
MNSIRVASLAAAIFAASLLRANDAHAYSYQKTITVQASQVSGGPHTDFPMLVNITDANLKTVGNGGQVQNANGYDIIFKALDATTCGGSSPCALDHEVEKYVATTGELVAWVRVPSISDGTVIMMYYGDSSISAPTANPTGVWNSSFKGVWHLKEDPSGTAPQMQESSTNANHGTSAGSMTTGDQVAAKIGGGLDFDGVNDVINAGSPASLDDIVPFTFSSWAYPRTMGGQSDGRIMHKGSTTARKQLQISSGGTNDLAIIVNRATTSANAEGADNSATLNAWQYVCGTYDATNGAKVFRNGVEISYRSFVAGSGSTTSEAAFDFHIGNRPGQDKGWDGILDEIRVANVVRSSGWMITEYNNQNAPLSFFAMGSQQSTPAISGTVFEDVNYGGGSGRTLAASSGSARSGARVELFDGAGAYSTFATTDGSGNYTFTALAPGNYTVRVVTSSVTSSRTGYVAGLLPVMTYRTDASSGTAASVTDYVGGHDPATADAGNAASGWILNTGTAVFSGSGSGKAHAFAPATVGASDATGVDFGWNFDTIVNKNDTGHGSLRQFITNANALGGEASLAQAGLTAARETSIFMITDGNAHAGLRAGLASQLTSGVAVITLASVLPTLAGASTYLDATTQTANVGDTNAGTVGTGGTVGVDAVALPTYPRPEVAIDAGNANGIPIDGAASNILVKGFAIYNGASAISITGGAGTTNVIRNVLAGTLADGTNPGGANRNTAHGIQVSTAATYTVDQCFVAYNGQSGILGTANSSSVTATYNELVGNGWNSGSHDALDIDGINGVIQYNLSHENTTSSGMPSPGGGDGLEIGSTTLNASQNNLVENNTFWGNVTAGATLRKGARGNTVRKNRFYSNPVGIIVATEGSTTIGNFLTLNSVYGNTNLGIDLTNDGGGAPNGVTVNNGTLNAALPNSDMDYPVFTSAVLSGTSLALVGYVGSAPSQSAFAGARVEVFKSDDDVSTYGEGQTYLGFLTADGSGNFSGALTVSGLAVGDKITGTASDGSNNTSEFGGNAAVQAPTIVKRAFTIDGDPLSGGAVAPKGSRIQFLLYIDNKGAAVTDVRVGDVLDAGFAYVAGTMRFANTTSNCAGASCSGAEEQTIFDDAAAGTGLSDAIDGDVATFGASTIELGKQNAGNAQLDIAAGKVWAVVFTVKVQ